MDQRNQQLAALLTSHSTRLQPGERVLIEGFGSRTFELVEATIDAAYAAGALPVVRLHDERVTRAMLLGTSTEQLAPITEADGGLMEKMDAYIGIRGFQNVLEFSDVPAERQQTHAREYNTPVHGEIRVPKTRWVVLRYPSPAFAQAARMSTRAFEDFFYDACLADYPAMAAAAAPLADLMTRTNDVRITGPGTDLTFSIAGIPAHACAGEHNIPDGECFTAPVRDSVNGTLRYNTQTLYDGHLFDGVELTFKDGRIESATCATGEETALNAILDRDDGARFIGEFAIAFNPFVRDPMLDILFDEKMAGSFHFTPGEAYDVADNGNRSTVHWDMVCRQFPEHGGGTIEFDGEVIRRDGLFTLPELTALNPQTT